MNYRRLLGDRHWPFETRFSDIVAYSPAPLLALRTLKSEVGCGLSRRQLDALSNNNESWRTNGEYGVIQFFNAIA
jgi:hypothetical protein